MTVDEYLKVLYWRHWRRKGLGVEVEMEEECDSNSYSDED